MKKQFEEADVDGSKAIDCDELQQLIKKLNISISPE